ncbi:MAG: glycosyltransferase [Anaerolineales bacterium]
MSNKQPYPSLDQPRIALLSVHTSPAAALGGKKTGGMNVYVGEIAREFGRRGIRVDIFTRVAEPAQQGQIWEFAPHVRLVHLPAGPPQALDPDELYLHLNEFRDAMLAFARREAIAYDFIYSHYWLSGWVAVQLRRRWGIPVAQMFHTLGRMKNRIADRPTREDDIRVRGESEVLDHADRIIAATPAERSQLLLLYRADRRKIDIVPPGVDLTRFHPDDRAASRAFIDWSPQKRHFLFVGRIERLKGLDNIFEAVAEIRQSRPDLAAQMCISIIGGDPHDGNEEMQRLQTLRDMLGITPQIALIGAKGQDVLPHYYRAAEALIMPSDYESFGMVALEAMACGTPVIASEVGGLAFLVEDGKTGYHIPVREPSILAQRIIQLLESPETGDELGRAAALTARDYSWPRIADQLLSTFTMLGTKPKVIRLR